MSEQTDAIPDAEGVTLIEDEKVLHNMRPSWSAYANSLIGIALLSIPTLGFGLVFLIIPWLKRKNSRYIITDNRVIQKSGILNSHSKDYRIEDIRQLQTGASWFEKMLGHGNIQFASSAGATSLITFSGISDYQSVANTIRTQQQDSD